MDALQKEELQVVNNFLTDELEQGATNELFKITDLDSLNWTFRKIAALKEKEKEIKQLAEKEKIRIETWERHELSTVNQSMEFFNGLISNYHAAVLAENPKAKTLSTPYGKAKARVTKEHPEKLNEETILQHVIESNMDEYIKQSLKWGDFKKELKIVEISGEKVVVDSTGQIVPGITVKPESITFSVEVG